MAGGRWETRVAIVPSGPMEAAPLARRLGSFGLETRVFEGSQELLRALNRLEVDGVVLDLRGPRQGGLSLVARLARLGLAPVVALVQPGADALRRDALAAGALVCVSDPSDVRALRRAVFAALTGQGAQPGASPRPLHPVREPETERRIPWPRPTFA